MHEKSLTLFVLAQNSGKMYFSHFSSIRRVSVSTTFIFYIT